MSARAAWPPTCLPTCPPACLAPPPAACRLRALPAAQGACAGEQAGRREAAPRRRQGRQDSGSTQPPASPALCLPCTNHLLRVYCPVLPRRYGVTVFYTAPTLIRTLMAHGDGPVKRHRRVAGGRGITTAFL